MKHFDIIFKIIVIIFLILIFVLLFYGVIRLTDIAETKVDRIPNWY